MLDSGIDSNYSPDALFSWLDEEDPNMGSASMDLPIFQADITAPDRPIFGDGSKYPDTPDQMAMGDKDLGDPANAFVGGKEPIDPSGAIVGNKEPTAPGRAVAGNKDPLAPNREGGGGIDVLFGPSAGGGPGSSAPGLASLLDRLRAMFGNQGGGSRRPPFTPKTYNPFGSALSSMAGGGSPYAGGGGTRGPGLGGGAFG